MRKIPSLFVRHETNRRIVTTVVTPGCEWVLGGEGIATRKWDGTACLVRDGALFKRYDAKGGKTPPVNFEPAMERDEATGHWAGWVPVGEEPESRWHREAFARGRDMDGGAIARGTYELVGPKVGGNPERFTEHLLVRHGIHRVAAPADYDSLAEWFVGMDIEGVVWWHDDGRLCKIKRSDFGLAWPVDKPSSWPPIP